METVDEYLHRHAVLDGQGNLDGLFVPMSVAQLAVELALQNKLEHNAAKMLRLHTTLPRLEWEFDSP